MKRTTRVCMLVAAMTLASSVAAADGKWIKFSESNDGSAYHWSQPTNAHGDTVSVWGMMDYKKKNKGGGLSSRSLFEFDCAAGLFSEWEHTLHSEHMASGDILRSYRVGTIGEHPAPESVIEALFDRMCKGER